MASSLAINIFLYFCYLTLPWNARTEEELLDLQLPGSIVDFNRLVDSQGSNKILGQYITVKVEGAAVGEDCDIALYTNYLRALYQAGSRTEFVDKMQLFLEHLKENPALESKSCFTRIPPDKNNKLGKLQFLKCDSATNKCICNDEEPYKSTVDPKSNGKACIIDKPTIGSKCRRSRSVLVNQRFYTAFRTAINDARTREHFLIAWNKLVEGVKKFLEDDSLESDRRQACFNHVDDFFNAENLECSPAATKTIVSYVNCSVPSGCRHFKTRLHKDMTVMICGSNGFDDNKTTALGPAPIQLYLLTLFLYKFVSVLAGQTTYNRQYMGHLKKNKITKKCKTRSLIVSSCILQRLTFYKKNRTKLLSKLSYCNKNGFPEINGATKGQPCDLDLYNTYLVPMYQAITRTIFIQGFNNLSLHLNQTPGLESKSCFSYTHADPTQNAPEKYRYLQCRAVTGQSEPSCECSNEEPYLSTSTPSDLKLTMPKKPKISNWHLRIWKKDLENTEWNIFYTVTSDELATTTMGFSVTSKTQRVWNVRIMVNVSVSRMESASDTRPSMVAAKRKGTPSVK
ncbi:unnamed protein product [Allacma fusca]|uniref:Uncharacterized protein n=1 Tax=Allacma fusca TaxID=39272 RepID=A0A8J2JNC2_9HEXA|nr:unnamed protein product [Allacma fusca]